MPDNKDNSRVLNAEVGLVILCMVGLGVFLMVQSHEMYQYSLNISKETLNPPAGKTQQVLPPGYNIIKDGYGQALLFFTLSLGALLLPLEMKLKVK